MFAGESIAPIEQVLYGGEALEHQKRVMLSKVLGTTLFTVRSRHTKLQTTLSVFTCSVLRRYRVSTGEERVTVEECEV